MNYLILNKYKQIIKQKLILILIILSFISCYHNDDPKYIHEHDAITKVIANVTQNNKTISYTYEMGKIPETIILNKDEISIITLQFFNGFQEVTEEIIHEKDEHFILYSFINNDIILNRIDEINTIRTDNKKLGLKTSWDYLKNINEKEINNKVQISLIHNPLTVDDTGIGSVTGGEIDLEIIFPIKILTNL